MVLTWSGPREFKRMETASKKAVSSSDLDLVVIVVVLSLSLFVVFVVFVVLEKVVNITTKIDT